MIDEVDYDFLYGLDWLIDRRAIECLFLFGKVSPAVIDKVDSFNIFTLLIIYLLI